MRLRLQIADAYSRRAWAYATKEDCSRAIADLNEALSFAPAAASLYLYRTYLRAVAHTNRGVASIKNQEYDKAIQNFDEAVRLGLEDARVYFNRGTAYAWKKEYDKALSDFDEAIRLDPKDAKVYRQRGVVHFEKKQHDEALKDYDEAIRLGCKDAAMYRNRGEVYRVKKQYAKAIRDYTESIRLDPQAGVTYNIRGIAYAQNKEYEKAHKDFEDVIRLNPNLPYGYNSLAWLLATCPKDGVRDGKRAITHATKACQLSDGKTAAYFGTLAAAHAECGNFAEAVNWQKQAMELGSSNKEAEKGFRQRLKLYEQGKPFRE